MPEIRPMLQVNQQPPRFAVVIPCFNEEKAILKTLADLRDALEDAGPYELIVVDDGSTDRTPELLATAVSADERLYVVSHRRNRGYGAALKTGILHATAEFIVIADADGTYPLDRISGLLDIAQEADMVVGARTAPHSHSPLFRRMVKGVLRRYASWIAQTDIPDLNSGLRVFRRKVVINFFHIISDGFSFTTTTTLAMLTNGFVVKYVPISYSHRIGRSKIKPVRDTLGFLHLIARVGLCFAPMRTLMPVAMVNAMLFCGSLAYDLFILNNLADKTVLFFLATLSTLFSGLLADVINSSMKRIALEEQLHHGRLGELLVARRERAGGLEDSHVEHETIRIEEAASGRDHCEAA